MGMSAFFCLIVTTIYVYQPKAQKCVGRPSRTARLSVAHRNACRRMAKTTSKADKKIERLQSTDASEVEARPLCGIYRPPRPEDLQVNLEIKVCIRVHVCAATRSHVRPCHPGSGLRNKL